MFVRFSCVCACVCGIVVVVDVVVALIDFVVLNSHIVLLCVCVCACVCGVVVVVCMCSESRRLAQYILVLSIVPVRGSVGDSLCPFCGFGSPRSCRGRSHNGGICAIAPLEGSVEGPCCGRIIHKHPNFNHCLPEHSRTTARPRFDAERLRPCTTAS